MTWFMMIFAAPTCSSVKEDEDLQAKQQEQLDLNADPDEPEDITPVLNQYLF